MIFVDVLFALTGNNARGHLISKFSPGILPITNGYPIYKSFWPLSLRSLSISRNNDTADLYFLPSFSLGLDKSAMVTSLLPKIISNGLFTASANKSKAYLLESFGIYRSLFRLFMLTNFFSNSFNVLSAVELIFNADSSSFLTKSFTASTNI